ncbi:uncharacterized protein LOC111114510 isoform X2 [Crassostrea virginica]
MTMVRSNGRPYPADYDNMGIVSVKLAIQEMTQQRLPEPLPDYPSKSNKTIHDEQVLGHVFNFGSSIYSKATSGYVGLLDVSASYRKISKSMKSEVFSINDGPKYNYLQWNQKKNCTNCTNKKIAICAICIIVFLGIAGTVAFIATKQDGSTPERQTANNPRDVICQNGTVGTCVNDCFNLCDGDYQSCDLCSVYVSCLFGVTHKSRPCNAVGRGTRLVWDDELKRCEGESSTCPNNSTV